MPKPPVRSAAGYTLRTQTQNPYGQEVSFLIQGVQPPGALYVSPNDTLVLAVLSPLQDVTVTIGTRQIDPNGLLQTLAQDYPIPATHATPKLITVQIIEGFLLSALARVDNAQRGQVFVKLYLERGQARQPAMLGDLLFQGYVTSTDFIGFPQTPNESALEGRGFIKSVPVNTGGSAVPPVLTVPSGVRWFIRHVECSVTWTTAPASDGVILTGDDASGARLWGNLVAVGPTTGVLLPIINDVASSFPLPFTGPLSPYFQLRAGGTMTLDLLGGTIPSDAVWGDMTATVEEFVEV